MSRTYGHETFKSQCRYSKKQSLTPCKFISLLRTSNFAQKNTDPYYSRHWGNRADRRNTVWLSLILCNCSNISSVKQDTRLSQKVIVHYFVYIIYTCLSLDIFLPKPSRPQTRGGGGTQVSNGSPLPNSRAEQKR